VRLSAGIENSGNSGAPIIFLYARKQSKSLHASSPSTMIRVFSSIFYASHHVAEYLRYNSFYTQGIQPELMYT